MLSFVISRLSCAQALFRQIDSLNKFVEKIRKLTLQLEEAELLLRGDDSPLVEKAADSADGQRAVLQQTIAKVEKQVADADDEMRPLLQERLDSLKAKMQDL